MRVRDKNQIKVLAPRPKELIPSWESQSRFKTADYSSFEIEGDISNKNQQIEDIFFEAAALEEKNLHLPLNSTLSRISCLILTKMKKRE